MYTELFKELSNIVQNRIEFLENIPEDYADLRERLEALPDFQHIDLWHDQVDYLSEEHPFPTPAIFFEFNTLDIDDAGELFQTVNLQIDMHVFWETFSDTYEGAAMQEEALQYLDLLLLTGLMFHGRSGKSFHQMRRSGTNREESGGSGNLYRISFQTIVSEFSAINLKQITQDEQREIGVSRIVEKASPQNSVFYDLKNR